jgi:hypothetical protein
MSKSRLEWNRWSLWVGSVAAKCYTDPWRCATTFIGPMGMGASFNKTSWYTHARRHRHAHAHMHTPTRTLRRTRARAR